MNGLQHVSRRRASTGPGYLYGPRPRQHEDDDDDSSNRLLAEEQDESEFDDDVSVSDMSMGSKSNDPSYIQALKAGAMSRRDSERKLSRSLALVKDYREDHRGEKIQELRDRFSTNKKRNVVKKIMPRRSSIASISSTQSMTNDSMCSLSITDARSRSRESINSVDLNFNEAAEVSRKSDTSFNMSTNTLPVANVVKTEADWQRKHLAKTDQIVESLVWFSFHTPRAVLEDLIAHEIDVWRRDNKLREQMMHREPSGLGRNKQRVVKPGHPILGRMNNNDDSEGSFSSLSDDGNATEVFDGNFSDAMMRMQDRATSNGGTANMIKLPKSVDRESALLFVDMSGFTKLSTMLDVESLSKVINSYFDMILSEVIHHGGDILKFAGDAFFAEWKVVEDDNGGKRGTGARNALEDLNASLASFNEMAWDKDDDTPKLATCVYSAARCATLIVKKFSDFQVTSSSAGAADAMLNVHCGIGVGHLVGLHVGDYKEDQEEDGVELRREFLILGEPIEQVRTVRWCRRDEQI
jgi:class 3 adenylate cyclase